jgi:hypothetical protein
VQGPASVRTRQAASEPTVSVWGPAAAILLVPLVVDPWAWNRYVPARWTTLALVVAFGVLVIGAGSWRRTPPAIRWAWAAVMATATLASAAAPLPVESLLGDSARRGGLLTLPLLIGAYLIGLAARDQPVLLLRTAPAATLVVVAAIVSTLGSTPLWASQSVLVGNSGQLGGYLVILLGLDTAVVRTDPQPGWRRAGAVALAAGTVALVLTGSFAAVAGGLALLLTVVLLDTRRRGRRGRLAAATGGATLAAVIALTWTAQFRGFGISLRGRLDTWLVSLEVVRARPLLGWGLDGFRHGFAQVVPAEFVATYGDERIQDRAHSLPLDHAAATGILGGLALLVLGVAIVRSLDLAGPRARTLAATSFGLGVFLFGWFPEFELAAVAALLAGLCTTPVPDVASPRRGRSALIAVASLTVVAVTAVAVGMVAIIEDRRFGVALRTPPSGEGSTDPVTRATALTSGMTELFVASTAVRARRHPHELARAAEALDRTPGRDWRHDAERAVVRGELLAAAGEVGSAPLLLRDAETSFRRAIDLAPNHAIAQRELGRLLLRRGAASAESALLTAADLRPRDIGLRHDLAMLALARRDVEAASRHIEVACQMSPDDPQVAVLAERVATVGGDPSCPP